MSNRTALVVEGGAMRGIFAAGILDSFVDKSFNPFQICIGVSSGANNLTAYLANMYQKTYSIYSDYMLRKNFINWNRFIKGGHLMDLDWLWDITQKEIFNQQFTLSDSVQFYIVLTKVATGEPVYINPQCHNLYQILKAGCAVPCIYRCFPKYNDEEMTDGGVADPLPVKKAYSLGAKTIVVIRAKSKTARFYDRIETFIAGLILRKHKKLAQKLSNYYYNYNESISFIKNPPSGVKIISIEPPNKCRVSSLTTRKKKIENDYRIAREVGNKFISNW